MTATFNHFLIFKKAWIETKYQAYRQGGPARRFLANSLRKAWAWAKQAQRDVETAWIQDMQDRVLKALDEAKASGLLDARKVSPYRTYWQGSFTKTAAYIERRGLQA